MIPEKEILLVTRKILHFLYKTYVELSTACHHFETIALWWLLDFKKLYLPYSLPDIFFFKFSLVELENKKILMWGFWFPLTLSHPIASRVEYLRGPINFRIAQHVWDDQIHLQNTHWKQAQNEKLIMQKFFNSISPYILYVPFAIESP